MALISSLHPPPWRLRFLARNTPPTQIKCFLLLVALLFPLPRKTIPSRRPFFFGTSYQACRGIASSTVSLRKTEAFARFFFFRRLPFCSQACRALSRSLRFFSRGTGVTPSCKPHVGFLLPLFPPPSAWRGACIFRY